MALNREQIMDALLARLTEKVPGMRIYSRRDQDFDTVPKPALILVTDGMERDNLGRWVIKASVVLWVLVPQNDKSPETRLNELVDQVVDAEMDDYQVGAYGTSLDGLVGSVTIAGEIKMAQGLGGVGEALIPLEIVAIEAD